MRVARGLAVGTSMIVEGGGPLHPQGVDRALHHTPDAHQTLWMEINGHKLESIAFMTRSGPLWHSHAPGGPAALVALRAGAAGEEAEGRWRAWARVEDPHVVGLLDVARHADGRWALVMERVEGRTLETLLAVGQPRERAARERIVEGIRRGLGALHDSGVVHGDVCPANIVVRPDGEPVLVDLIDPLEGVLGTPGWSSGGAGGRRGDLESLALLARELGVEAGDPSETGGPGDGVHAPVPPTDDVAAIHRRLSLGAVTEVDERPPLRHRVGVRAVAAAAAVLVLVGGALLVRGDVVGGVPFTRAERACPQVDELRGIIETAMGTRDAALVAGDVAALDTVMTGSAKAADEDLLARLTREGTVLRGLTTRLEALGGATCTGSSVEVAVTLRQTTMERCREGVCREVGALEPHGVVLRLVGDPLRIGEVLPG